MIPKIVYCNKCHKPIQVPKIAGQINVACGFVTIECGNCKNKVKVKTEIMSKEKMIQEILEFQPHDENGKNGVPLEGNIVYNPLFEKFGYLYLGIYERWIWFTRTDKAFPEKLVHDNHTFLEDATEKELNELLLLLKEQNLEQVK